MLPTQIACLGLSHQSAPVELRERISRLLVQEEHVRPVNLPEHLAAISEIVLLTTCNRIELYVSVDRHVANPRQLLLDYLTLHHETPSLQSYLYFHLGQDAVRHLIRVASGLESQILGEPQILGQVTRAFMQATEARTIGPQLTVLFRGAIRAGKRARAQTAISSNPISIASAAIALADRLVGPLHRRRALVVGLGEMGQLALNALRKRNVREIALANRNLERARQLQRDQFENVYSLDQLSEALVTADFVITATASSDPIIDQALMQSVLEQRDGRDLVLIDIALPRDVEPAVGQLPHIHLFNMDDLRQSLDAALEARRKEIPHVEHIIDQEMNRLEQEFHELAVSPLIADLRLRAEEIRQRELRRTLRHLGDDVDAETLRHIQHLSRSLVNKLLHEPTLRLRQHASNGQAEEYSGAIRELFALTAGNGGDNAKQETLDAED